jgi:alpha-L-fucosidase 2
MLIQNHEDYIEFLPALPKEWNTGYYKGLCVRGGATANVSWEKMTLKKASLKATVKNSFSIKLPYIAKAKFLKNGKAFKVESIKGDIASINLEKNDIIEIQY